MAKEVEIQLSSPENPKENKSSNVEITFDSSEDTANEVEVTFDASSEDAKEV